MISADDIEAMKPTRWVKIPAPGQFRGEGEWKDYDKTMKEWGKSDTFIAEEWEFLTTTGYLPTKIQDEKPVDEEVKPAKYHSLD